MEPLQKRLWSDTKTTVLNDNAICEGCGEKVRLMKMPILGGPDKGKMQTFKIGCKCEDKRLAEKAIENRKEKMSQRAIEQFERVSLISPKLLSKTFDDYEPKNQTQAYAKRAMEQYAKNFNVTDPKNAYCHGSFGVGKSHLAKVTTDKLMEKGITCIFISVPKLFRKIKSTYNKQSEISEDKLLEVLEQVDCLVLDDVGSEAPTKWALETLFSIIDSRQGKHTIYTSNFSPDELLKDMSEIDDVRLQKQAERNFSRILNEDTKIINIEGENYRLRQFVNQEESEHENL